LFLGARRLPHAINIHRHFCQNLLLSFRAHPWFLFSAYPSPNLRKSAVSTLYLVS
jgi:hypothetical protein